MIHCFICYTNRPDWLFNLKIQNFTKVKNCVTKVNIRSESTLGVGVPQGFALGTLLFQVFRVNNVHNDFTTNLQR